MTHDKWCVTYLLLDFLLFFGVGANIRIHWKIVCHVYAGFFKGRGYWHKGLVPLRGYLHTILKTPLSSLCSSFIFPLCLQYVSGNKLTKNCIKLHQVRSMWLRLKALSLRYVAGLKNVGDPTFGYNIMNSTTHIHQ